MNKSVLITFEVDCPEDKVDELKNIVNHHIEYLVDIDGNRDLVKNVYNASVLEKE